MAEPRSTSSTGNPASAPAERAGGAPPWRTLAIERARHGDRAAFDQIIEPLLTPTFRTALAILGSEADARDACQEAFISAWRELPRLRDADRFDAWFGRVVVNACRGSLRSRGRRRIREIHVDDATAATIRSRGPSVDERTAEIDRLQRAFERLSVDERTLLALHYLEHRSLVEIASVLGVPEGTVKSRMHAARRSFERALEVTSR